jgi:hypothetical protein
MVKETVVSLKLNFLTGFLEFTNNITRKSPFFEWYKK